MRCSLNLYSGPWPCGSVWRDTTATRNRSSRRQLVRHRACSPPPPGVVCAHSLPIPQLGSAQGRHRTGVRPLSPTCTTAGSLCVPPESHARRAHRPPCCQSKAPCGSAGPAAHFPAHVFCSRCQDVHGHTVQSRRKQRAFPPTATPDFAFSPQEASNLPNAQSLWNARAESQSAIVLARWRCV
jgi:hypothetical protein